MIQLSGDKIKYSKIELNLLIFFYYFPSLSVVATSCCPEVDGIWCPKIDGNIDRNAEPHGERGI